MDGIANAIDWSNLPAITVMGLVVIIVAVVTWKQSQVNASMLANALEAGAEATKEAVTALKDTQSQSHEFYATRLEDMRAELRRMEDRVRELEAQIEDKDNRIAELERENERLHGEIDALRRRLDGGKARPTARSKERGARSME